MHERDAAVRAARPSDAPRIAFLAGELGYPMSEEAATERLAAIARDPGRAVLVAGGPPILGFIEIRTEDDLLGPRTTEIEALVVDSGARSRGIGGALLAAALERAREGGAARVRVRSRVARERAHAFYERAGFRLSKTQHVFSLDV